MPRFRIAATASPPNIAGWHAVNPTPAADDPTKEARLNAERAVAEVLQCDQVLVLAGLGTSLCIKDPEDDTKPLFPTMGVLWDKVSSKVEPAAFGKVQKVVGLTGGKNIEELLSRCQMKLGLEPSVEPPAAAPGEPAAVADPDIAGFIRTAEEVIREQCRRTLVPGSTETHEDFLRRLVRRGSRRPRANIFTTNYDVCFETAAARIALPIIDGFGFSLPPRFQPEVFDYDIVTNSSYSKEPDLVPRLVRLFKLHGSVDWHLQDSGIIKNPDTNSPVLIYPQSGKYAASYSPPFLEIMSRFQGLLRQRNVGILAICCGFNDLHLAEPVLSAVKSNASLRMVVCAPDLCAEDAKARYPDSDGRRNGAVVQNKTLQQIDHLITNGDGRLALLNGSFPDLVRLMPLLAVQTDAEQHEVRIKKLETDLAQLKAGPGATP